MTFFSQKYSSYVTRNKCIDHSNGPKPPKRRKCKNNGPEKVMSSVKGTNYPRNNKT